MVTRWCLLLITLLLTGCFTFPEARHGSAEHTVASSFSSLPDKAVLYVYRKVDDFNHTDLDLEVNGEDVVTKGDCYLRIELPPGKYNLEADITGGYGIEGEMDLELGAGQVTFIEMEPISRYLVPNVNKLHARTAEQARRDIMEHELCALKVVELD